MGFKGTCVYIILTSPPPFFSGKKYYSPFLSIEFSIHLTSLTFARSGSKVIRYKGELLFIFTFSWDLITLLTYWIKTGMIILLIERPQMIKYQINLVEMSQSGERVTYLFILLEFRQKNHFIGYFYWDFNKYCWTDKRILLMIVLRFYQRVEILNTD